MTLTRYMLPLLLLAATTHAADFSGRYVCEGRDAREGKYAGIVTLDRVPEHSRESHDAYRFTLTVPGFGRYEGQAVGRGRHLGVHFALTDQTDKDYGTGLATFTRLRDGRWSFSKFYYEPEYHGGNHGLESCVQERPVR